MSLLVVVRGGGDLASGVALRLFRAGIQVLITELSLPTMVRRKVSFGEAMYQGEFTVEGVTARRAAELPEAMEIIRQAQIPVLADAAGSVIQELSSNKDYHNFCVLVDARMRKQTPETGMNAAALVIGLGPGFSAGENCHAVVETRRGHFLGRVIWQGEAEKDTGIPDQVNGYRAERVLRSPVDGVIENLVEIGEVLQPGQIIARVAGTDIVAPFGGNLRGLIHSGLLVQKGEKIGDVDPRKDGRYCTLVSDKSLAIGGGVLEAILSRPDFRSRLA